jgi:hypothetical protein
MRAACRCAFGLLLAAMLAAGCASHAAQTPAPSGSPHTTTTASASSEQLRRDRDYWQAQARSLSGVLATLRTLETSWTYEPRGDIAATQGQGILVFADLVALRADGSELALDCAQYFLGDAAIREAQRDGAPFPEELTYSRNCYQHVQTFKTDADCVVVPWTEYEGSSGVPRGVVFPAKDLLTLSSYWYVDPWEPWSGHTGWYHVKSGHEAPYWVIVQGGRVTALFEIWHP